MKTPNKVRWEYLLLALFSLLFLLFGPSRLLDGRISHPFPYGYFASDAFVHQTNADALNYLGSSDVIPFWKTGSLTYKSSPAYTPPLSLHLSVLLSNAGGISVYDTVYLQNFLFLLFSVLAFYLIIKRFNREVALLSLPITFFIFKNKFLAGLTWGQWDMYTGAVFLMAAVYALINFDLKYMPIILAVYISGAFMAHTVEAIWAIGFIFIYLIFRLLTKSLSLNAIKGLSVSGALFLIISFHFLITFLSLLLPGRKDYLLGMVSKSISSFGYPVPLLGDFGWLLAFLAIGTLVSLFLISKKGNTAILFGGYMLLIGYSFYIGFDKGAQTRMLWPLYLMPLFGVAFYFISKKAMDSMHILKMLIPLFLLLVFFFAFAKPASSEGIMSQELWDQMAFIRNTVPDDKIVYYFYGDRYSQWAVLLNSMRTTVLAKTDDLVENLKKGIIREDYKIFVVGGGASTGFERTSLFSFRKIDPEDTNRGNPVSTSFCTFDYFVFDRVSMNTALSQYNMAIRDALLKNDWFEEVYANGYYSILKNNKPGVKCVN